jgi:replication factor C subunit 1
MSNKRSLTDPGHDVCAGQKKKAMSVSDFFRNSAPLPKPQETNSFIAKNQEGFFKGATIVFTGNMSIDRERAVDLAVSAGAKVTSAVSSKTTYLVAGSVLEDGRAIEEGSKFRKMRQLELEKKAFPKLLTESEFMNHLGLPQTSASPELSSKPLVAVVHHAQSHGIAPLWVDKYAPQSLNDFVGNASTVKKITEWLSKWKSNSPPSGGYKPSNFPGRGGNTEAKAVLLSGSPGIGKSLLARLACQASGFQLIEYNASDYRSKASVDLIGSSLSHSSFTFSSSRGNDHMIHLGKQCLVMDEVDGMSAGDRGGNQALIKMIKDTSIPIICICNDRMNSKVRSLANYCYDLKMGRPTKPEVMKRAKQIISAEKANADVPESVIDQIVDGADCDIRQVINQLEGDSFNWKSTVASFEKKDKSTTLTPFEACRSIIAPSPSMTLNDRLDMFFVDYDLIPLLIQQNYLKCFQPGEFSKIPFSANLISFGDVISRTIRAEQNWNLLPVFGLIGNVFVPPKMEQGYSPFPDFPMWLGKNSTTRKSARIAQELQCIVSVASSITSRNILISNYAHVLYVHFVNELNRALHDGSNPALPTLDLYGVSKNDLVELLTELLLPWQTDIYAEKFDAKSKAAVTRICNAHHASLKSGGAHFRRLKSAGEGPSLSLAIGDERGDKVKSESDSEDEIKAKDEKKDSDLLVKTAKPTARKSAPKKKAARKA